MSTADYTEPPAAPEPFACHLRALALTDPGPCSGRLVKCHLIPQQLLRREHPDTWRQHATNPASWVWGCGGPMGNGGHHGQLDQARTLRIPRRNLPPSTEALAVHLGLGWWLDREYGQR